jgi:hypothetical protein
MKRTVEETVFAALSPLVPGERVYPVVLPQDCAFPAIRYSTAYATREVSLCGIAGLNRSTVQVDLFAREFSELRALRESVLQAMIALPLTNVLTMEQDGFDSDARLFRWLFRFSISEQEGRQ